MKETFQILKSDLHFLLHLWGFAGFYIRILKELKIRFWPNKGPKRTLENVTKMLRNDFLGIKKMTKKVANGSYLWYTRICGKKRIPFL